MSIDLVLMDIQMPGLNGYQATRIIKKQRPRLPVIALTAFASNNEKEKSMEAGCDDYLTKPIRPQQLLDTMNRYIH
jgi:CheY-like chemotaxis protein